MSYTEFASIYDELMRDVPYDKWVDWICQFFDSNERILELACGTGNATEVFAKNDWRIDAIDCSSDMLTVAYAKLRMFNRVRVFKMDMTDFETNSIYGGAFCSCDGINYLMDNKEIDKFFQCVYKHLKPGATFVFDMSSVYKFENILQGKTIVSDEDSVFLVWENEYDTTQKTCDMMLNFFVKKDKGLYQRMMEHQTQKAHDEKVICNLLQKNGFEKVRTFDDYTNNRVRTETERIVFVTKRKEKIDD